ncbi:MAG TPA: hypothetical protein VH796_08355 [Nitrososphaeraceae archaeon]|jgi:hypothetical protein
MTTRKEDTNTSRSVSDDKTTTINSADDSHHSSRRLIDKTFEKAKDNIRVATDEAHRELPRYMQTVTDNQEQIVQAARGIAENYLESQREITSSFQSIWTSFFDNYFWNSPKRMTETYARAVSSFSDGTIATIRMYNNMIFTNTGAIGMSMQYVKANTQEISRVLVNSAKMIEEATNPFQSRRD